MASAPLYRWQFHFQDSSTLLDDALPGLVSDVYRDGFGRPQGWSIERVQKALVRSTVIGLLWSSSGVLDGYAFYSAPDVPLKGSWLLWEDAICLRKPLQGRGLSTRVLIEVSSLFPDREFGWLGGRTQNPLVLKRYLHRATLVLPLNLGYDGNDGEEIMTFLLRHIEEACGVDPKVGIFRNAYKDGRLGDYKVDLSDPEVAGVERRLAELNFDRDKGDAVIATAKLKAPLPKYF